jgi:uncharacterized protein YlxP (DUF503 family)
MIIGILIADLLLDDVHSLKEKRSVVRPVLAALRRFEVTVAETGDVELHRRAEISVAALSTTETHLAGVLDSCERAILDRPEYSVLSVRRRVLHDSDLD